MKREGVCEYLGGEKWEIGLADDKIGYSALEFSLLLVDLFSLLLLGALDCLSSGVKDALLTPLSQLSISSTFWWGASVIGCMSGTR